MKKRLEELTPDELQQYAKLNKQRENHKEKIIKRKLKSTQRLLDILKKRLKISYISQKRKNTIVTYRSN